MFVEFDWWEIAGLFVVEVVSVCSTLTGIEGLYLCLFVFI